MFSETMEIDQWMEWVKIKIKTWARGIRNNFEGVENDAGKIWTKTKTLR